jgi:hypothetical protein
MKAISAAGRSRQRKRSVLSTTGMESQAEKSAERSNSLLLSEADKISMTSLYRQGMIKNNRKKQRNK